MIPRSSLRRWWVQRFSVSYNSRNFMSTFGLVGHKVLELFVVIGNGFAGFFDQTEFEMLVMFVTKIKSMCGYFASPRETTSGHGASAFRGFGTWSWFRFVGRFSIWS